MGSSSLLLGLNGLSYYSGFSPFLNWWKTAAPLQVTTSTGSLSGQAVWDNGTYLDPATGEITNPTPVDLVSITRIFFTPPGAFQVTAGCDYSGETWIAKWDGTGTGDIGGLTSGGSQDNSVTNQISFTMGSGQGAAWLNLTISNPNDPPRNVRIHQARYAANVANGEKFNPDWISQITPFGVLRFMDWLSTNSSTITDFPQLADESYLAWGQPFSVSGTNGDFGPKGSLHPSLICQLANLIGKPVHVCIPVQATDAFVTALATYMKANTNVEVTYELSNECWNWGFQQTTYCLNQGNTIWPGDGARNNKWYGYRAAACMNLIRDVYNDSTRWRGALATQTGYLAITGYVLEGVNYWRQNVLSPANSLQVHDLFKSLYVTGYFGDVTVCAGISGITKANPGVVYVEGDAGHGYTNGQAVKIFIQSGMTQLNNVKVTVTVIDTNNFSIGIDTTSYSTYASGNNFAVPSLLFDMMDQSAALNSSSPATYPTKYTYFNQQISASFLTGTCTAGYTTSLSVYSLRDTYWPGQMSYAQANGLDLRQYEGGSQYLGDGYLTGYGGNTQYTEYLLNNGWCPEMADVYAAMYATFKQVGGKYPAKFVEGGGVSQYGTWPGIFYYPTVANSSSINTNNPIWQATVAANTLPNMRRFILTT